MSATRPNGHREHRPPPTSQAEHGELLGIGAAAAQAGVSERALRYYQQLGLLEPACTTPGGLRRYSADDLARVARIRELQTLLGLNLDEIAIVLHNEDRLAQIRRAYRDERTSDEERYRLGRECLALLESLRADGRGQAGRPGELPGRPGRPHRALQGRAGAEGPRLAGAAATPGRGR